MGSKEENDLRSRFEGLWRHPDFLKLWTGETISLLGSHITVLALPLTAVLVLQATPFQMGILGAARFAPFLLVTLLAGVWVDRHRRRPILIAANLGRAALMGLIPLLAFLGQLRMEYLYVIVFFVGMLTVFFDLAYQSYLPALVNRRQLVEANSKLQASASAAEVGGPGLAGILVELFAAPLAILLDALSFLVSSIMLVLIHKPEPAPTAHQHQHGILHEIGEGMRVTFGNPYLRAISGEAATYNMFSQVIETVFVLYATRELGIGPGLLGFIIAAGSIGALLGSLLAGYAAQRWGTGPVIIGAMLLACLAPILIPLAAGSFVIILLFPILAYLLGGIGVAISNVHVVSLRQTITPDRLLGRMNASYRLVIFGTLPVGALLGGVLGDSIGLRATLAFGALGLLSAVLWVLFSPVPRLRQLPAVQESS
jgi:MFS family permease